MHALVAFHVRQWDLWPAVAVDGKNDKLFLPPPYPIWPRPWVSACLGLLGSKQQEGVARERRGEELEERETERERE